MSLLGFVGGTMDILLAERRRILYSISMGGIPDNG